MMNTLLRSVEPSIAVFPPTYVTSVSRLTVKINNDTNKQFRYQWRYTSSEQQEKNILSKCDLLDPTIRGSYATMLSFKSDVFEIESPEGDIRPNQSEQISITFRPLGATTYSETAFLVDTETGERVSFSMTGVGLPPEVSLDVSQINVGHVNLDHSYVYQINITNNGKVPARFQLVEKECPVGIEFVPSEGKLEINESKQIRVHFVAAKVGQFREFFDFDITYGDVKGDPAQLTICGRVMGPCLSVSKHILDYGVVSFGFMSSQEFEITNMSEIPLDFNFEFAHNSSFECRELAVIPSNGILKGNETQVVRVDFIPITVQDYTVNLMMDSSKIEERLATIVIKATCICPEINILTPEIDLGRVFIGHKYSTEIQIEDNTVHPAKFEFVETHDQSILQADISCGKVRGILPASQVSYLPVYFTPLQLGNMRLRREFKILGSNLPPISWTMKALSVGPDIEMSVNEVNFGLINVLCDMTERVTITNNSPIAAPFRAKIESSTGVFRLPEESYTIPPHESHDFRVIAHLDDTLDFTGEITFYFDNLLPIKMSVSAKGSGTAIVSSIDMGGWDMDYMFTKQPIIKKFTFENHGRREQVIKWAHIKPKLEYTGVEKPSFKCVFSPDEVSIEPHQTQEFTLTFTCTEACRFTYNPQCYTSIGKKRFDLFKPTITGVFINPELIFQHNTMDFVYIHNVTAEEGLSEIRKSNQPSAQLLEKIVKSNSLTNKSELPLIVSASIPPPFFISVDTFDLDVGASVDFDVTFDPSFKMDFTSDVVRSKVMFKFKNNPATYSLNVKASLLFPNVSFDPAEKIDFGCLMKNTEESRIVKIANSGSVPATYTWELVGHKDYKKDIAKIFDVYPIKGILQPGEDDSIHFTFFAMSEERVEKVECVAICHIYGGPDYFLNLSASAAEIQYSITPEVLDLGARHFAETINTTMTIQNLSDVPFDFNVKIPKSCGLRTLSIQPMKGRIMATETTTFKLKLQTGLPQAYHEKFFIQVGHFDERQIDIHIDSGFPQLQIGLPRDEETDPLLTYMREYRIQKLSTIDVERTMILDLHKMTYRSAKDWVYDTNVIKSMSQFKGYVGSVYTIDFGEITLGEQKTKTFSIQNTSNIHVSFEIISDCLNGSGFSIDRSSVIGLPPGETISAAISFDSNACKNISEASELSFEILVVFGVDFAYKLLLNAKIIIPSLVFSTDRFDFETTVVGQSRTMRLQITNNHIIPVEFEWGKAESIKVLQRKRLGEIFTASVTDGILPPSSIQNIEITFTPVCDKNFSMQFPVKVKYNPQPFYFTVHGTGNTMKLQFNPPEVKFPPVTPLSEPSFAEFEIINPTGYPVEVYSPVFDFKNFCELIQKKYDETKQTEETKRVDKKPQRSPGVRGSHRLSASSSAYTFRTEEPKAKVPVNTITRFSFCIVVHGPQKSGKTTTANLIASIVGDVPVISLKEFWLEMFFNERSDSELEDALRAELKLPKYANGFVIDGLDCFSESPEAESFVTLAGRQRAICEEIQKNPLVIVNGACETAAERALRILTRALCGQCLIIVGLRAPENIIEQHILYATEDLERKKEADEKTELDKSLKMEQEEYNLLTPEAQEKADRVRGEYRKALISTVGDDDSKSIGSNHKRPIASRRGVREGEKPQKTARKTTKKGKDSRMISQEVFQFTFGHVCEQFKDGGATYETIELRDIIDEGASTISKFWVERNVLVIDVSNTIETLKEDLAILIPTIDSIRENTIEQSIVAPETMIPDIKKILNESKDLPKIFTFANNEAPGELPVFGEESAPRFGRRRKSFTNPILGEGFDVMAYTKRWILEPNQRETIKLRFSVDTIGDYSDVITFKIVGTKDEPFDLKVYGVCTYPDIDRTPEKIFGKVVQKMMLKTEMAWVQDNSTFYFGGLLIGKEKTGKKEPAPHRKTLSICNTSAFPADVSIHFSDSGPKSPWSVDAPSVHIPAGETGNLTIGFNPTAADRYKTRMSLFVKDNPDPLLFNIAGDGCIPTIEPPGTQLDFGKILTSQERTLTLNLKNTGRVPVFWRIRGAGQLPGCFKLSASEGLIDIRKTQVLSITFASTKAVVMKKPLQIDLMDKNKQRTFSSYHCNVTAEAFDVNIDFQYPKGIDHLNFGALRVNQQKSIVCTLKNKGKYPSLFKFFVKGKLPKKVFTISPKEGMVPLGDKGTQVTFTLQDPDDHNFENKPGLSFEFYDGQSNTRMAHIPIPFTYSTVYPSWRILPENKLDFGAMRIGVSQTKELVIENNGVFPFDFEMIPNRVVERSQSTQKNGKGKQKRPAPKPNKRRGAMNALQLGQFTISQSSGTIQPGTKTTIQVDFMAQIPCVYDSSVIFKVKDADPDNEDGIEYDLCATACMPGIVTHDFEKIFPNQPLCLRFDIQEKDTNAFLEDEQCFHFSPTIINQEKSVKLALLNQFPVPCNVALKCLPVKSSSKKAPQSNTLRKKGSKEKLEVIRLSETFVEVPASGPYLLDLIFNPTEIKDYKFLVEATVESGTDPSTNSLTFGVDGKGSLPSIVPVDTAGKPMIGKKDVTINIGRNLIGFRKMKKIPIKNNGIIPARLIVTATATPEFELENIDFVHDFVLDPDKEFNLIVGYRPTSCKQSKFPITVSVPDNPKSNISVVVTGEGYSEDIIFENFPDDSSDLVFKDNIVGRPQSVTFTIRNACEEDAKFEWQIHPEIKFSPHVGHLHKGKSKSVTATFFSDRPVKYSSVKIMCTITKINLLDPLSPDWDDSMKVTRWVPRHMLKKVTMPPEEKKQATGRRLSMRRLTPSKKTMGRRKSHFPLIETEDECPGEDPNEIVKDIQVMAEPKYIEREDKPKDITLMVSAISDFIKYHFDTNELTFGPTMMFDKERATIEVKNTSQIRFDYQWVTSKFQSVRSDYAKYRKSPFSVLPVAGFIEAGASTTFTVTFCPEEVDDFNSHIRMEIPFLSQMPTPEVFLSGFSRRPICHIGAEVSDYISAGRRHPHYSYPLPDDVRVIELFSPGIGKLVRKKFEIINTTEFPYEVFWESDPEHSNPVVKCETPRAFISSGQHHMAVFTYKPVSVKTVESLWHFTIPEHNIHISVVIVGRMMR